MQNLSYKISLSGFTRRDKKKKKMNWRETKTKKSELCIMKLPPETRKVIFQHFPANNSRLRKKKKNVYILNSTNNRRKKKEIKKID